MNIRNTFCSEFSCVKNPAVADFLHNSSIRQQKSNATRTYLIQDENQFIHAYFSLAIAMFSNRARPGEPFLSNEKLKRMKGYTVDKGEGKEETVYWSFLIGQIGRNDRTPRELIDLGMILELIYREIERAKTAVGGNIILLEAVDNPKLVRKYLEAGFQFLQSTEGHRQLFIWNREY
ncbi:MAG: hypothetical protein LBQ96_03725 [Fusobacteriaceae bacterium]|nr:hypothetical protein [Fusobacteriaceae bacterium]